MFRLKSCKLVTLKSDLTFCVLRAALRNASSKRFNKSVAQATKYENINAFCEKYESKVLYSSFIESKKLKLGYKRNQSVMAKAKRDLEQMQRSLENSQPLPLSLKYLGEDLSTLDPKDEPVAVDHEPNPTHFPYESNITVESLPIETETTVEKKDISIEEEIRMRNKELKNWMTSYENYEHDLEMIQDVDEDELDDDGINYGTPNPNSRVSNVPCGGCGALLHCKDPSIPGYIPSEIFDNHKRDGAATLQSIICQRCYFLKEHNTALQVSVSAEDYPKILSSIRDKQALVVLMVDLMDFPCSIWPGLADILGPQMPIHVVGNKVDLLPKDQDKFLKHVSEMLIEELKMCGFGSANILGVSLISAKTGFGVENFISCLTRYWNVRGDVYIVGCTNVGKSSLFNALIKSDYCKVQASDLIQRATVSQWPGTTLNLLKFPIMKQSRRRLFIRQERLKKLQMITKQEEQTRKESLRSNNAPESATLIGRIGQSYTKTVFDEPKDVFANIVNAGAKGQTTLGINERHPDYIASRWCYDTPGVVQQEQIINLLTVDELMLTIPKEIIRPETFCVKPRTSLFIAGLARLDFLDGPKSIRMGCNKLWSRRGIFFPSLDARKKGNPLKRIDSTKSC
ncbi:unnamed protein product [Acanthoscelides obtectus]|uniref:G domain-containing protein n=1 Tax=Acanthoscelides obtectus TaxID=200917 RepID=A0A9P0K8T4_ACAOB|nr:unnamed protein product [Acanthoscelides obtectus]CAK1626763.1 Nitric oxide-associated protein 1 [Acanthoscelides obtectus]